MLFRSIGKDPVPERQDGRLANSFPLEFPTGEADPRQPRLRSDFSFADYIQHKFRYFDGRFWNTTQGQRVAWALFNTALREESYKKGDLVHRRSEQHALTKAELRNLVEERDDLVRQITTFGADIPTTPMFWKKEGNHLEWIVRQMSWCPPWCRDPGSDGSPTRTRQRPGQEPPETVAAEPTQATHVKAEDGASVKSEVCSDVDLANGEEGREADDDAAVQDKLPPCSATSADAADTASTPRPELLWRAAPTQVMDDPHGYGRNPAF